MRLRWTVVDPVAAAAGARDVVVRCPQGTPLGAVLEQLRTTHPVTTRTSVRVGDRPVGVDAVVGLPPLLDGAVLTWDGPSPTARTGGPPPVLELAVTAGPDAGTVVPLTGRRLVVGRGAGCDVRLSDPRLSRRHFCLTVSPEGVAVADAGSTNGTGRDGADPPPGDRPPGGGDGPVLRLGEEWSAGAGRMRLRAPEGARPLPVADTGDGTQEVRRPPRARQPEAAPELVLPAAGRAGRSGGFPVLAVLLPAVAAAGLAWWTGSAVYLALAAVGPLLVAGTWWTARREARRDGVLGRRAHARACADVLRSARAAGTSLAAARAASLPDAVSLLDDCLAVAGRLWERHHEDDDAVRLRLGRAAATSGPAPPDRSATLTTRVRVLDPDGHVQEVVTPDDLLSVDLRAGALGVVEAGDPSCARFLVGQLVVLLPPTSVTVVPLVGRARRATWDWLRLLPHTGGPDHDHDHDLAVAVPALVRLVASRIADPARALSAPLLLVVVDDPDGEIGAGDLDHLVQGHRVGVHVVAVAEHPRLLPRLCAAVLAADSPDGVVATLTRVADGAQGRVVPDRVSPRWSSRVSRALAPLRVADPDGADALPASVPLQDLLDLAPDAVARRWAIARDDLAVHLGVSSSGPLLVDLTTAGPHALVAGTTGAGKSELLRSWVLALAATQPPEHLALLLVDYKGGATFDDLADLPHCVGLLTDLDGPSTSRVLHSLRAEVRRREHLLATAGARDLASYRRSASGTVGLPRLLVVVDEFRVLSEDAPEVLGEFVRLAATGRSLGIHLVLATQRPAGVVSADIRANSGLRVALRVQDAAESRDVVDRPDAAWLPPGSPGRAVLVGAGVDAVVQTAWTGGTHDGGRVSVTWGEDVLGDPAAAPTGGGGPGEPAPPPPDGARAVVRAVLRAAASSGRGPARPPWLPPLPAVVTTADTGPRDGGAPDALLLGLADLPWSQSRGTLTWRPTTDGPLLVLGAARSGRSTTLAVAAAAAAAVGVPVVRLSAVAGTEDHVLDVLTALGSPVPGSGMGEDGGAEPGPPGGARPCRVLLVVDDVDEVLDPGADPAAADALLRLVRSGHRHGVGVVLAGGRALAASRVGGAVRARLVHRTLDRGDALVAGVPVGAAPLPPLPGRCHAVGLGVDPPRSPETTRIGLTSGTGLGVTTGTAVEAQVLLPAPDESGRACGSRVTASGDDGSLDRGSERHPPGVPRPLPVRLGVAALPGPTSVGLPAGTTGPAGAVWWLDLGPGGLVVVAGSAGSGRTTTLRTLRSQAVTAGLQVRQELRVRSGPRADPPVAGGRPPDPLATQGGGHTPADLLLVDDVDLAGEAALAGLEEWLRSRTGPLEPLLRPTATVVVGGATAWFAEGFRGLPALARQAGRGVVLAPVRTDVRDVLGVRGAPTQHERHPGRGLLVEHGTARRVQVALPPGGDPPPASARGGSAVLLPSGVTTTGGPPP